MQPFTLVFLYLSIPSLLLLLTQRVLSWRKVRSAPKTRFPGPQLFPIVGRVHDLDRFSLWRKFTEWANIYGPIYQTRMMNDTFIIISDETIAEELLVKRGHIYSGRPQIRSLIGHKDGPAYSALMDRNDSWTRQRKWVHAAMADSYRHHFHGHIEAETKRWLAMLLLDPAGFLPHTREHCGRIMTRLAWDDATLGADNGVRADRTLTWMSVSGPITNTMTPLWHLPFAVNPWKKYEVEREREQRASWVSNFRIAKKRFMAGELPSDTWTYRYFDQLQREGNATLEQAEDQELFSSCMIGFFSLVGVVTISGPLKFFIMAMTVHLEWQRKVQEEVDRVCGDRMPTIADYAAMPITRACLKETLRWRSGVPLGVPHRAERDDEYRGVLIKKDTIILACEWAINRVESKYPDPDHYRPERWLEPGWPTYQEPLSKYPNFREGYGMHTFGWGRRACLGKDIAQDEMFVSGAAVCWAFDMSPKKCPATGKEVPIDTFATNAHVILEPLPWEMTFKPRGEKRVGQVLDGYKTVRADLKV